MAMRRILPIVLLLTLLTSCDLSDLQFFDIKNVSDDGSSFIITEKDQAPSSFTLLLTSDQHFSRADSGVYYEEEVFFEWIQAYQKNHDVTKAEKHLDRMITLGDITENSATEEFKAFSDYKEKLDKEGITTHAVKGNHDIRPSTNHLADWKTYVGKSYQAMAHKGVSFYLLNTANRTLGRTQMRELRNAVEKDSRPKIFFSHIPLYGSPSLVYFVLSDMQERENMISLMVTNKGMLYLAGHHHQGDVLYSFRKTTSEFILGTFHGRDSFFEKTKPRWYLLYFDAENASITITRYQVEENTKISQKMVATLPVEL